MSNKEKIYELLAAEGVNYDCLEHVPVYTMEEMDAAGITAKGAVCKNLFLRDAKGKVHYLVTVPEETRIDLRTLGEKLGTKLSFASAERLQKYLAVEQGCVSPLGVLNDESKSVIVVFDGSLRGSAAVGVHPNDNTATIWLAFADLERLIKNHGNEVSFVDFG